MVATPAPNAMLGQPPSLSMAASSVITTGESNAAPPANSIISVRSLALSSAKRSVPSGAGEPPQARRLEVARTKARKELLDFIGWRYHDSSGRPRAPAH